MTRSIFKLLIPVLVQIGWQSPAHAQISATRYIDDQGVEVIVNRNAAARNSLLAQPAQPADGGLTSPAAGAPAVRAAPEPMLRISAAEQDRRDRDRIGILQEELATEARKYAAAMQRAQNAGNKTNKLSATDSQRLTQELYDHQKNIQALNSELRRTRSVQ
ncbi:hypothetical protein IFT74_02725 [Oxalobacteraceae sp. CFBP 8755]|jgi:hypothetical protein|nr:hypothetical protein [Oxalobacteraceae sp. CFBP 8761]MBD8630273.1 hypothetical protein [Oxalobacteraceae sp. CFBP 8755]